MIKNNPRIKFLKEGLKNIKTIGTVTRSSRFLCSKVVSMSDLNNSQCVVELGAGDGVMTKYILNQMPQNAKLLAFEINPNFCEELRQISDERLHVIEDSAENMEFHLKGMGFSQIDTVFSALPFVVFPQQIARSIVSTCHHFLKPLGTFLQIHYSLVAKELYKKIFGNVDVTFHLLNIPPAFILECRKVR